LTAYLLLICPRSSLITPLPPCHPFLRSAPPWHTATCDSPARGLASWSRANGPQLSCHRHFASAVAFSILPTQQAAAQHGHHGGHHGGHYGGHYGGHHGGHYGHGVHLGFYGLGHVGGHYYPYYHSYYPYYGGYSSAYRYYYPRSYGYGVTYGQGDLSAAVPANPLPGTGVGTARVTVVNPPESTSALSFSLAGQVYTLEPSSRKEFRASQGSIVEFDRGGAFGRARYTVSDGIYTFTPTDRGWELYHSQTEPGPPAP